MEDILVKRREIFFNNLILLGLNKIVFEKKYGITFHKDMFVLPNKKGYEIVTYFLFSKLNSATGKDYNIQWPLLCKEHERIFQKTCCSHLMNFSQENDVKFPRIVPSLLSTFGGDRFYDIFLAFSSYVLYKTIKKSGNVRLLSVPSVSQENYKTAKKILQLSTILNMKKFRDVEMISYCTYSIWIKFAKILEESLGQLKRLIKCHDELIKKKKSIVLSLYPTLSDGSFNLSKIAEKCFEYLKPVLKERKILDKFLSSEQKYWQYLCSEVGENAESEFLNGQDYRIEVTDFIPEEYVKELKDTGCLSSSENGKLSVTRFIKIFMAHLTFIIDLLKKANLNDLHKTYFVENASSIEDDLKCIQNLNKKLDDEVIPEVEKNIKQLQILTGYHDIQEDLELTFVDHFPSLQMLSYDIEAVKQRTSYFDSSLEMMFDSSSTKHSKKDGDFVFLEKNPVEHSFTSLADQNFTSKSSSFVSNIPSKRVNSTTEEKELNYHFNIHNVPTKDHCPSTELVSPFDISNTFDTSFQQPDFKMNESWLQEELLHTITIPEMSFEE